jgi:hypothetical protein
VRSLLEAGSWTIVQILAFDRTSSLSTKLYVTDGAELDVRCLLKAVCGDVLAVSRGELKGW